MKRFIGILLLSALGMSCHHAQIEYVDFDTFKVIQVKSGDIIMKDGSMSPDIHGMEPEDDVDTKVASITTASIVKELLGYVKGNTVVEISGIFNGHDIDGSPLPQSGKLILPKDGPIKNMILVSHFTIGANYECPSQSFPMEGILASKGYAVVLADYIGFGLTVNRVHPYMHTLSTSMSVVDMGLAVKSYLEHIGRKPQSNEVILVGYSQGGSTTMAVMGLIQKQYSSVLPIKKVYAGGGPYDLAATFDYSMSEDRTGIPCAIPMIVQGINEGERLGLDMADFFTEHLLSGYQEWINSKKYTVGEINRLISSNSLREIMTDTGRDKTNRKTAALYKQLMMNSTLNFYPKYPVYMLHSTADNTVPFINAQRAEQYYKENRVRSIQYDFGDYGAHSMGFLRFLTQVSKDID